MMKSLEKISKKREQLLRSPFYWLEMIRHSLTSLVTGGDSVMTQTELAGKLNVSKSNVSIFLSGSGDFKMSSLVNLSVAAGYVPVVMWMKLDEVVTLENGGYSLLQKERIDAQDFISLVAPHDDVRDAILNYEMPNDQTSFNSSPTVSQPSGSILRQHTHDLGISLSNVWASIPVGYAAYEGN